jgi:thiol-disulfide isomerase/thioredoxin
MTLATMEPNPAWDAVAYEETVETLSQDGLVFTVWGADWCGDCRKQLPDFAAALEAAEVPADRIEHVAVDRDKQGPGVEEYGIEYIPTVVVERDGEEVARFVEEAAVPIAVYLADQIDAAEAEV